MSETQNHVRFTALLSLMVALTILAVSAMAFMRLCSEITNEPESSSIIALQSPSHDQNTEVTLEDKEQTGYVIEIHSRVYCVYRCEYSAYICWWHRQILFTNNRTLFLDVMRTTFASRVPWEINNRLRIDGSRAKRSVEDTHFVAPCGGLCQRTQKALSISTMALSSLQIVGAIALTVFSGKLTGKYSILWLVGHSALCLGFVTIAVFRLGHGFCFLQTDHMEWIWLLMLVIVNAVGLVTLTAILWVARSFELTLAATGTRVFLPALLKQRKAGKQAGGNTYEVMQ